MASKDINLPTIDAYVDLCLLDGGSMIGETHYLHAGEPPKPFRLYNWAFLIQHPKHRRQVLWDLGMSPVSHALKHAKVFFGPATSEFCSPGHFQDPSSQWDGRFFDLEIKTETWETLPGPWMNFGAFDHAMDFFGDQSFCIIKAPGHMPGNLCTCARLKSGEWVLLASDCCHSRALLDGTKQFGMFELPNGSTFCLHTDVNAAKDTLARLRTMEQKLGVHIALAHDTTWMKEEENYAVLHSLLDGDLKERIQRALPLDEPL